MHLLLTDRLACPRCGPAFGLILLARRLQDRRVLEGELGCANCRQRYGIEGGLADLRLVRHLDAETTLTPDAGEDVLKVAALLGIQEGAGAVLLVGDAGRWAPALADLQPEVHWIVTHSGAGAWSDRPGVERLRVDDALPFFDRSLRGVVIEGGVSRLEEVLRVIHSHGRIVVLRPEPGPSAILDAHGFQPVLDDPSAQVAARR